MQAFGRHGVAEPAHTGHSLLRRRQVKVATTGFFLWTGFERFFFPTQKEKYSQTTTHGGIPGTLRGVYTDEAVLGLASPPRSQNDRMIKLRISCHTTVVRF